MTDAPVPTPPYSWELCRRCGTLFEAGAQCPDCPAPAVKDAMTA